MAAPMEVQKLAYTALLLGVLDRVDALLFNGPLVFVYLQFARGFVH